MQGCISEHNSTFTAVEPEGWSAPAQLNIENVDTLTKRNITIYMRYRPSRELVELPLTITTTAPNGATASDEVTLYPARNKSSRWSSTQLLEVQYRINVVWSQTGRYRVEIEPKQEQRGVELIGINITQSKSN